MAPRAKKMPEVSAATLEAVDRNLSRQEDCEIDNLIGVVHSYLNHHKGEARRAWMCCNNVFFSTAKQL